MSTIKKQDFVLNLIKSTNFNAIKDIMSQVNTYLSEAIKMKILLSSNIGIIKATLG